MVRRRFGRSFVFSFAAIATIIAPASRSFGGAALEPPVISKDFTVHNIDVGTVVTMGLTIHNPNPQNPLSGLAFTDNLPAGLTIPPTPHLVNTCGGTVTGNVAGSSTVSLSGGFVGQATSCEVVLFVVSSVAGTLTNITGNVTSTEGGTGNSASASIFVGPTYTPTQTSTPTVTPTTTPTNTPVPQGGVCSVASQCAAPGFCVDSVCCNSACTDPLAKCNLPGQAGTCASAAAAAPTLTPWGLIVAALLLTGVAGFALRYRVQRR